MSEELVHTLALTVAYRGSAFSGFARQLEQLTVQGELERALNIVLHRCVETTCAGRTDAGVHARGQVVSFDISGDELRELEARDAGSERPRFASFRRSLNAITHEDITVRDVRQVVDGFSARFDAVAREYRYYLAIDEVRPVFMCDFAWHVGPLDLASMYRASRCLIGEHDFKSFCRASSAEGKPTCRNLIELSFSEENRFGENMLVGTVVGRSLRHSMVRSIVGTLVMVGKGKRPEGWVAEALAACDRTAAGECAPACGLVFWEVRYA